MKTHKQGNILILFAIVVLTIICLLGYSMWFSRKSAITNQAASTTAPSPSPIPTPIITPTPEIDPKTGWKIYKDTSNGFMFEYPAELNELNGVFYTELPSRNNEAELLIGGHMVLSTFVYGKNEDIYKRSPKLEDSVGTKKEVSDKVFEEITGKLNINGYKAIKIKKTVLQGSQTENQPGTETLVIVKIQLKNGKILNIIMSLLSTESDLKKYHTSFSQILSTFKFTSR